MSIWLGGAYLLSLDESAALGRALGNANTESDADNVTQENSGTDRHGSFGREELGKGGDLVLEDTNDAPDTDVNLVADTVGTRCARGGGTKLNRVGSRGKGKEEAGEFTRRNELVGARRVERCDERENKDQLGKESEGRSPATVSLSPNV
jgi:hypothetical protein